MNLSQSQRASFRTLFVNNNYKKRTDWTVIRETKLQSVRFLSSGYTLLLFRWYAFFIHSVRSYSCYSILFQFQAVRLSYSRSTLLEFMLYAYQVQMVRFLTRLGSRRALFFWLFRHFPICWKKNLNLNCCYKK